MVDNATTTIDKTENKETKGSVSHTGGYQGVAALKSEHGSTVIADGVVSKISGIAAREVVGVHDIGGGAARAFGTIRERIPGGTTNYAQGVSVEVGSEEAAVDLDIVAEYGVAISDVAEAVRRNVINSVGRMTGLKVIEVNINVNDVHLPEEYTDHDGESSQERSSRRRDESDDESSRVR